MEAKVIKGFPLVLRMDRVLQYVGISPKTQGESSPQIERHKRIIRRIWKENKTIVRARIIYQPFNYRVIGRKEVLLFDKETGKESMLTSRRLVNGTFSKLKHEIVVIFIATFGDEFFEEASVARKEQIYLDAIGSEGTEAAARYICKKLGIEYGYRRAFKRLSPGFGQLTGFDWNIDEQKKLFDLIGREKIKEEIGVELMNSSDAASFLMVPRKTISAIAFL